MEIVLRQSIKVPIDEMHKLQKLKIYIQDTIAIFYQI